MTRIQEILILPTQNFLQLAFFEVSTTQVRIYATFCLILVL